MLSDKQQRKVKDALSPEWTEGGKNQSGPLSTEALDSEKTSEPGNGGNMW